MIKIKENRNSFINGLLLVLLLCLTMLMPVSIANASAETTGEAPHSVQTIIDNTTFIAYRTGAPDSKYGRCIFACFYVPDTVYEEDYAYGLVIFPKNYGQLFGLNSDYIRKAEEQGVAIISMETTLEASLKGEGGNIFKFGIANILDQNVDRNFAFIFYVKDTDGNIEYSKPQFATYSTLDAEYYSEEELLVIAHDRLLTVNSFKKIVENITELVNSILKYVVLAMSGVVVVWGSYIGIRVIIAKRKEEQINSKGMLKSLLIGVIVMFTIAVAAPLLINGLSAWITW